MGSGHKLPTGAIVQILLPVVWIVPARVRFSCYVLIIKRIVPLAAEFVK